jgi:sugar lactone lactonase YvrE
MPVWDLSAAAYATKALTVNTQDIQWGDVYLSADNLHVYALGSLTGAVYQYDLTVAGDLSTGSYASKSATIDDSAGHGLFFKPDGTAFYIAGDSNNRIEQYALSTPWDLSTKTNPLKRFSVSAQTTSLHGLAFSSDGSKMYSLDAVFAKIYQYTLSTPWEITSASYASKSFASGTQDGTPTGLTFKPDGTMLFIAGDANNRIYQYTLSTPWDVTTASYASTSFSIASQSTLPVGLAFRLDTGESMYVMAQDSSGRVYQYTLGSLGGMAVGMVFSKA